MNLETNAGFKSVNGAAIQVGYRIECLMSGLQVFVYIKDEQYVVAFSKYHLGKGYFSKLSEFCKDPVKIII